MIDISNLETLKQYLLDRGISKADDDCRIDYCGGGVSGTVAFVQINGRDMIIKQALAKLKVAEDWQCDPNRMQIEMKSNDIYHKLVPDNAPEVYFYDHDNYILGRAAAPEHCVMWKSDLLGGILDFDVAKKVIYSLVTVHNECSRDKQAAEDFADKAIFYDLRIAPYIEFILKKHPQLTDFTKPIIAELMDSAITLIHGDFSPKNIMLDKRKVYIMDFEVAHYGHPSFDLAFFSTHFVLKSVKNRQFGAVYLDMLNYMLGIYFDRVDCMDKTALENSYVRLLSLIMIARVDGKSPAEYLTDDGDKELMRSMAFEIINRNVTTIKDMLALIRKNIEV